MKVRALFLRAKFRDYYDLYYLASELFTLDEIFNFAILCVPGISLKLFYNALLYIDDIDDENIEHLKPKFNINMQEIRDYFEIDIRKNIKFMENINVR